MMILNDAGTIGLMLNGKSFPATQAYSYTSGGKVIVYEMGEPGTWVWHCHIVSHVKRTDGAMFGMLTGVFSWSGSSMPPSTVAGRPVNDRARRAWSSTRSYPDPH